MSEAASKDPTSSAPSSSDDASAPSTAPALSLETPIQFVPGVGPKRARLMARLGIETAGDLIQHAPHRYEYEHAEATIGDVHPEQIVSARGEIGSTRLAGRGRKQRFEANLIDASGRLHLTWFNAAYLRRKIHPGMVIRVQGKVKRYGGYLQMVNPKWEAIDLEAEERSERFRPVYPATEDLSSDQIDKIVQKVLDQLVPLIPEPLPDAYRKRRDLCPLAAAFRMIHRPATEGEVAEARRRLAFDELFLLQLGVAMRRHQLRDASTAPALGWNESIDRHIVERFPFELTPAQINVIEEIRADLCQPVPMNRMLQGDVGAGKTVVAVYAMLMAVAARHQAALMAPTELLAEQHFASISNILDGSNVKIELLTGTLTAAERQDIRNRTEAGEVDILVGTHALLSESVNFDNLAVVVIDEQHRFGVQQRATLRRRASEASGNQLVPHTLVMTATPIPRTLSLTLFGDLDVSVIKGLPPGRSPVITRVVGPDSADTVYEYVAKRLRENDEQAYIVLPAIDDNPESDLKAVRSHLEHLEQGPMAGLKLAAVHGRLKRLTRERIMDRFRRGLIDGLVATTVIEVGVDVPNASLMVVEHAERFGLSQLHQLRGRVGRGTTKSLCTFIGEPTTEDAEARLQAIAATTDGFEIAEKDFEIRGMGEILGTRQSGLASFRTASLPRDLELLNMARRDAREWIAEDPHLDRTEFAAVREVLMNCYGTQLGIADVG